ncbi:MAG: NAD(P)H-flavin reductase [Legionella sp.]|jgi:CDP-4-dehydro-6-deoxyglucose reductase|nr:NAD(P)H-flavin reductase [Legionella sp.]
MSKEITSAHVTQAIPLTRSLLRVTLTPEHYIPYEAGQYLQIISSIETLFYSIANAPLGSHTYELHIRHTPNNLEHQHILNSLKQQGRVILNLPFGKCTLNALDPKRPIIFIAGGTGFAPIKAMIEQLLTDGDTRSFELYWSARCQEDLYLDEQVLIWKKHIEHFDYIPHIKTSHQTTLIKRIQEKHPHDLADHQVVLAGPFDLVYSLRDDLIKQGLSPNQLFSDAFDLET